MTDLHIHTSLSFDSSENADNYLALARANGDGFIGFSEHYDYDAFLEGEDIELCDLDALDKKIAALNERGDVNVLKGIELGFSPSAVPHYAEILRRRFDYAVLSVHRPAGRGDCYYNKFYEGLDKRQAYETYLGAVLQSVNSNLDVQIIAHIGYITRYAPYVNREMSYADYSDLLDEILKGIIRKGLCLELNTGTNGSGCDFLPYTEIAERYIALGGENFTVGSDAHRCGEYRRGFGKLKDFLLSAGIKYTCRFEDRKIIYEKI